MLAAEGLLRDIKHPVPRDDHGLIKAMEAARTKHTNDEVAMKACRINAVTYKGNNLLRKKGELISLALQSQLGQVTKVIEHLMRKMRALVSHPM